MLNDDAALGDLVNGDAELSGLVNPELTLGGLDIHDTLITPLGNLDLSAPFNAIAELMPADNFADMFGGF